MSANVMSIPMAGSCSSLAVAAGCGGDSSRGFTQRVIFENAAARPADLLRRQATKKTSTLVAVRGTAAREQGEKTLTGVVFEPFREVASSHIVQVPANAHESLARQRFDVSCESAINNQINVEYNASYVYHALFSYFHRDNIALPGLANYFREQSEEEREHAETFITYQNKRGGRVKLQSIILPEMEFANADKGDALFAMELTLSLEKLVTEKLYALHNVAEEADDVELAHYVKSIWLTEQIQSIKKVSELVAQLRRIGHDGHGVYYWDRALLEKGA